MSVTVVPATFQRRLDGPAWTGSSDLPWRVGESRGWASNGGAGRKHPARALPLTLSFEAPEEIGIVRKLLLVGVFARYADEHHEPGGSLGANLQLLDPEGQTVQRLDLICGKHYGDASKLGDFKVQNGDGTSRYSVGSWRDEDGDWRVDVLEIEVDPDIGFHSVRFRDMGTPASFVIFDAAFELEPVAQCPFRGHGAMVALSDVGKILRLRDRTRFERVVRQLREGIEQIGDEDLDEARGMALTFLAVASAALLELGAPRTLHRAQLEAARRLERASSAESIADEAEELAFKLGDYVLPQGSDPSRLLVDRAVAMVERHYSQEVSDATIAGKLGLSTSHFRHLFKQHTQQPFHKFLVAVRLEKAREMVVQSEMGMAEIAEAVGFTSAAHFSRVFHQRFQVAPSALRTAQKLSRGSAG